MRDLKPVTTVHKDKVRPFCYKSLSNGSFLRCKDTRALEEPYEGPYKVLSRPSDKVFEINKQGKGSMVTVERLKPAYLEGEFEEPAQATTPTQATNATSQAIPGPTTSTQTIPVQAEPEPPNSTKSTDLAVLAGPSTSTQASNVKVQARPRGRPKGSTNSKGPAKAQPKGPINAKGPTKH